MQQLGPHPLDFPLLSPLPLRGAARFDESLDACMLPHRSSGFETVLKSSNFEEKQYLRIFLELNVAAMRAVELESRTAKHSESCGPGEKVFPACIALCNERALVQHSRSLCERGEVEVLHAHAAQRIQALRRLLEQRFVACATASPAPVKQQRLASESLNLRPSWIPAAADRKLQSPGSILWSLIRSF